MLKSYKEKREEIVKCPVEGEKKTVIIACVHLILRGLNVLQDKRPCRVLRTNVRRGMECEDPKGVHKVRIAGSIGAKSGVIANPGLPLLVAVNDHAVVVPHVRRHAKPMPMLTDTLRRRRM